MDTRQAAWITEMKSAITAGSVERVRDLLDQGCPADIDLNPGPYPFPALDLAARELNFDICKLLLERGANVHGDATGWSVPLRTAAGQYKPLEQRIAVCKLFLEHGANPNDVGSSRSQNAMHHARLRNAGVDVRPLIKLLMSYGGDLSYVPPNASKQYLTPAQDEAWLGDSSLLRFMFEECGVNPFEKTVAGRSLLQLCTDNGADERKATIRHAQKMFRANQTLRAVGGAVDEVATPEKAEPVIKKSSGMSPL